jgi:hypothetical protein
MKETSDGNPAPEEVTLDAEERARLGRFFRELAERKSAPSAPTKSAPTKSEAYKIRAEKVKEMLKGKDWLIEKVVAWQVHRAILEGATHITPARLRKFRRQASDWVYIVLLVLMISEA